MTLINAFIIATEWTLSFKPNYERLTGRASVRILRNMSESGDRTEERSRAVEMPKDGVKVAGGREGTATDEEVVPNVVAMPPSCINQAVNDMIPDQAHAAVAHGLLAAPQMQRLLGGPPLTHKELPR